MDLVTVPREHPQCVRGLRQRDVANQVGELAIEHDAGQMRAQVVADLALDLVDVVDQTLQRAVFGDPLRRRLLAHPGNAGQVVTRVAPQRREVRVLRRGEAVLLHHRVRGEPGQLADSLAGVQHGDVVVDQLQGVTVAGDHQHAVPLPLRLGGQRGDDVVGLEPGLGEDRDAQRAEHLLGDVDLAAEFIRGRRPARLVLGVLLEAEGLARDVERRGDVARLLVTQQIDQHRGEAVHGVGGQPALGLEVLRRQRIERPERQRVAVEQHQRRLGV